jgi:putative transposase
MRVVTSASCNTKAGEVQLRVPKLRAQTFETAIIERYRRRESSVEEALIEMYLAGVSVRRVEDKRKPCGAHGCPSDREVAWPALDEAAELVEAAVEETLAYYAFPEEHWRRIRTNNPLERILREIRRRTRVVGSFPDGQSALNLAVARLRHIAGTEWSTKRYLNIELLKDQQMRGATPA